MSTRPTLYTNARLIDPATGRDETGGLLVEDGYIADLGPGLASGLKSKGIEVIDCQGHVLAPGLIDMRVFTGEPGSEHRETLATAGIAAAAGGITTMVVQPNTDPVIEDAALVQFIRRRGRETSPVRVEVMAALSKGLEGREMTEIGLLADAGAVAFSDGDHTIGSALIMRRILAYAKGMNALVVAHAEEPSFSNGVMNEGLVATALGLHGNPTAAEAMIVDRDMRLVALTGGRYHLSQITCAEALEILARAKKARLPVTAGVSAHHLALNENDIGEYRSFFKVRPPLRAEPDRQAVVQALADGLIDVVVSSHQPQDEEAKRLPFDQAAFGAAGLESLLPVLLSLYHNQVASLSALLAPVTCKPAEILGLDAGRLAEGAPADLVVIDPDTPWQLEREALRSKSTNTPFEDHRFQGRALRTIVGGKTVFERAAGAGDG